MKEILGYLVVINLITFFVYGMDKHKSRYKGVQRIPEKTLLGLATIGGSVGALAGMYVFWHKIRKPKFYIGVPLILAVQTAVAILISVLYME